MLFRQHQDKGATFAGCAPGSDRPSVTLRDALDDGESHSGAGVFTPSVEPLERLKNLGGVLLIEADSVVLHADPPHRSAAFILSFLA